MAHILIVEDDVFTAKLLKIGLERYGHTVVIVADGNAAFMGARENTPDLILLDVLLPGMNGFQILKQLKQHPLTKQIPVFMLTALTDGVSIMAGLDGGAESYLSKPVDILDLVNRIRRLEERRRVALQS